MAALSQELLEYADQIGKEQIHSLQLASAKISIQGEALRGLYRLYPGVKSALQQSLREIETHRISKEPIPAQMAYALLKEMRKSFSILSTFSSKLNKVIECREFLEELERKILEDTIEPMPESSSPALDLFGIANQEISESIAQASNKNRELEDKVIPMLKDFFKDVPGAVEIGYMDGSQGSTTPVSAASAMASVIGHMRGFSHEMNRGVLQSMAVVDGVSDFSMQMLKKKRSVLLISHAASFLRFFTENLLEGLNHNRRIVEDQHSSGISEQEKELLEMYRDDSYEPQVKRSAVRKRALTPELVATLTTQTFALSSYSQLRTLVAQSQVDSPISDDIDYQLSLACMAMSLYKTAGKENPRIAGWIFHPLLRACGVMGEQTLVLNAVLKEKAFFLNHRWVPLIYALKNETQALDGNETFLKMLEFGKMFDQIVISTRYARVALLALEPKRKELGALIVNPSSADEKAIRTVFSRSLNFIAYINEKRTLKAAEEIRGILDAETMPSFTPFQNKGINKELKSVHTSFCALQKEFKSLQERAAAKPQILEYVDQIAFVMQRTDEALELIQACPFQQSIPLFVSTTLQEAQLISEGVLKFLAFERGEYNFWTQHDLAEFLVADQDGEITEHNEQIVADELNAFAGINYPFQWEETLKRRGAPRIPGAVALRIASFQQWKALQAEKDPDASFLELQMQDGLSLLNTSLKVSASRLRSFFQSLSSCV